MQRWSATSWSEKGAPQRRAWTARAPRHDLCWRAHLPQAEVPEDERQGVKRDLPLGRPIWPWLVVSLCWASQEQNRRLRKTFPVHMHYSQISCVLIECGTAFESSFRMSHGPILRPPSTLFSPQSPVCGRPSHLSLVPSAQSPIPVSSAKC